MLNQRKKRLGTRAAAAVLCAAVLSGALAGCSQSQQGDSNTTPTPTEAIMEPQDTTPAPQETAPEVPEATEAPADTNETTARLAFTSVTDVTITDPYAVNGLDKEVQYLLSLDADKLLYWFYRNAALTPPTQSSYGGGWEGALIGGHTLGHYLSAIAQASVNAGTSEEGKAALNERIAYIMDALKTCQDNAESAGAKAGFLWGAKTLGDAPEIQFDNVEMGRTNIATQAWVPWYTMHKLLAGILDVYTLTGNETALAIAKSLGDWVVERVSAWDDATQKRVLAIEYGGMNDALYNLYAATGEDRYAAAAHKFDEQSLFNAILSERANYLNNLHANTTIPKVIGALNRYMVLDGKTVDGETVDASEMLEVAEKFWTRVTEHHTYVTGGNSEWEHFGEDDVLDGERTNANCETCNTYNMLKLSRMLFSITKDKKYLDYYEDTYFNAIWSSQNPETGMTTYFQPMATGYFKVYSTPEDNFWCCTGSGMENFTKLNDSIYYADGANVYVAMYLSSEYRSDAVSFTQAADLENSDEVSFHITDGAATLYLRVPYWTAQFAVALNGEDQGANAEQDFVAVPVQAGDTLTVTLQKTVTAHALPDGENTYAFLYGPFVLSAELGTRNMSTGTTGVNVTVPAAKDLGPLASETIPVSEGTVEEFMDEIDTHMVRGEDGKFTLEGTKVSPLTYSIHFRQYTQRYGLYFTFANSDVDVQKPVVPYELTTLDTVQPGYGQYEQTMEDSGSVGSTADTAAGGTSRYATEGGSFTYWIKVEKGAENYLVFNLVQEDNGKTLLLRSGDTVLYSEALDYSGQEDLYEVRVRLPDEVVNAAQNKTFLDEEVTDVIPITVSGIDGAASARLGSFVYTKVLVNHLAYFVDCGDWDPTTLSDGDVLGKYNSVTEQVYGADPVTGKMWGIWDDSDPGTAGSKAPHGLSTNSTWANEQVSGDGIDKSASNRYTKNQFENGVDRNLHYKFELEDGIYTVVLYFSDPWSCSKEPTITANGEVVAEEVAIAQPVQFPVTVSGGELTLDITSEDKCINLCYIQILFGE